MTVGDIAPFHYRSFAMSRLQTIYKYAQNPAGCAGVSCVECALIVDPLCETRPLDDAQEQQMYETCKRYMEVHPDEFTIENITAELL